MPVRPDHVYAALNDERAVEEIGSMEGDEYGITGELFMWYRDDDGVFVRDRFTHQYHAFEDNGETKVADWVWGTDVPDPLRDREDEFYDGNWIVNLFVIGDEVRDPDMPLRGIYPHESDRISFDRIVAREQWLFEEGMLPTYGVNNTVLEPVHKFYDTEMLLNPSYSVDEEQVWTAYEN